VHGDQHAIIKSEEHPRLAPARQRRVSLIGGLVGMAFLRPETEAARFAAADAAAAATQNRLINAELTL
jgi:hypothetical protein